MKELLVYSEQIKHLQRSGWLCKGITTPETVASHSWQMAIMALYLSEKNSDKYDFNKIIKLCLCHDLAESIIGDIPPSDAQYSTKSQKENIAMKQLSEKSDFAEAYTLFLEYENQTTPESMLANDLDKLDMFAQSLDYERKYPKKDLSEFRASAIKGIKTELGKQILEILQSK